MVMAERSYHILRNFVGTNKKYRMVVKGASSNSTTASVSVYIGGMVMVTIVPHLTNL